MFIIKNIDGTRIDLFNTRKYVIFLLKKMVLTFYNFPFTFCMLGFFLSSADIF